MKLHLKLSLIILGTDLFPSLSALQLINELIKIINLNLNSCVVFWAFLSKGLYRDFLKIFEFISLKKFLIDNKHDF